MQSLRHLLIREERGCLCPVVVSEVEEFSHQCTPDRSLAALDAATILGAKQVLGIHNNNWLVHFILYIMIRHISRYVHRH